MLMIGDANLTISDVENVARGHEKVALLESAKKRMADSRACVDGIVESQRPVYGINTGFGELSSVHIPAGECEAYHIGPPRPLHRAARRPLCGGRDRDCDL